MELNIILQTLARKWRVILLIFLVTLLSTVAFTLRQQSIYEAKATYIGTLNSTFNEDNRDFATVLNILSQRVEILTTFTELAISRQIRNLAAQELGIPPEIQRSLIVGSRQIAGTNILEITVQGTDPILVRDFANAVGARTTAYVHDLYTPFELASLDQAITPRTPIRPRKLLNTILGGVFGLALGAGVAFALYYIQEPKIAPVEYDDTGKEFSNSNQFQSSPQLRQDLINLQAQLNVTNQQLEQTRLALNRTQSNAKDGNPILSNLEAPLEENHTNLDKPNS